MGVQVPGLRLFHGTSSRVLDTLAGMPLKDPFLTDREDLAHEYAVEQAGIDGSSPRVVVVEVLDTSCLRYDSNAVEEPVMVSNGHVAEVLNTYAASHPEWLVNGLIFVPRDAWWVSLEAAASVRFVGECGYDLLHYS